MPICSYHQHCPNTNTTSIWPTVNHGSCRFSRLVWETMQRAPRNLTWRFSRCWHHNVLCFSFCCGHTAECTLRWWHATIYRSSHGRPSFPRRAVTCEASALRSSDVGHGWHSEAIGFARLVRTWAQPITGISHKHEQQAAHALIDACFQMVESGSLIYIAPSKCGSRDQEVQQDAKSK